MNADHADKSGRTQTTALLFLRFPPFLRRLRSPVSLAACFCAALGVAALIGTPLTAQVAPNKSYFTITTPHFHVHFTRATEAIARRVAADAERAYAQLASELHAPRGPIDVVVSDDADFSNGSATPFPTNRIVVYANPPVTESALRYTDDWAAMVITHELTHIFHLDRSRGVWRLAQWAFGRSPYLFPNEYAPAWLTEGLAVYYESRFTGAGRVAGSEHSAIARAAAVDHAFPALNQVSLASPRFPFGESAYAFGSLFVDYLARTRGAGHVGTFVEKASAELIPFWLDLPARQGFGISFTRAYRNWRDSVFRQVSSFTPSAQPLAAWRDLTRDGVFVSFPRWLGDSALTFTGTPGREVYAAWRVDREGRRTRLGRRNSSSPQVRLVDGGLLFSQLDFTSPYEIRSDLYVQRGGRQHRLTRGGRLASPDARVSDGAIVAMQTVPGGTRLVRVSRDGRSIAPLTGGGLDEQWAEPRWSHAGDRIAGIRWRRGGVSEVVVLDSTGHELQVFASGHAVQATPSWTPNDSGVFYSSDRSGTAQIYLTTLRDGREYRVSEAVTGLFEPEAVGSRSSGTEVPLPASTRPPTAGTRPLPTLAAVVLRGDGYHLGVGECCRLDTLGAGPIAQQGAHPVPPVAVDSSPARRYSPWRLLVPRYWSPSINTGMHVNQPRLGGETSAYDAIGRHAWSAAIGIPTDNSGIVGGLAYSYAGLGLPIVDAFLSQDWTLTGVVRDRGVPARVLGEVRRRIIDGEVDASWIRQRYRSALAFTVGSGAEQYTYVGVPSGTIALVDTTGIFKMRYYPRVLAAARYARTQAAPYSISPEDGFTVAATVRERWRTDVAGSSSSSVVGAATAYKSLNLPGFAHHVLALRGVGGARDDRATGYLEVGGTSGTPVEIIAGYTVGEGRKDFGVRGFVPSSLVGTRAYAWSAEYRLPLVRAGRGLSILPLFVDRSSLTLFRDVGSAWCPYVMSGLVCTQSVDSQFHLTRHRQISSYGAELNINAAILSWDAPYRFRFGVAHPDRDEGLIEAAKKWSVYFASGLSF